jgi:hypothetical protein
MSMQLSFKTYDELIESLRVADNPVCMTINYIPDEDEYLLDVGNQPYYSYEKLIELEQEEKQQLRDKLESIKNIMGDVLSDYIDGAKIKQQDLTRIYKLTK